MVLEVQWFIDAVRVRTISAIPAIHSSRAAGSIVAEAARSISSVPTSDCMAMSVVNNRSTMSWGSPSLLSIRPSAKTTSLARMRSRFSR